MDGPGEYLKRERELRGVSIDEISDYTKVSVRLIRAFESDEHESLPEPIFIRGLIRAYCRRLGLDENDALLRYELFLKDHPEISGIQPEEPHIEEHPRSPTLVFAALVLVGLLIILMSFFLISRWSGVEVATVEEAAFEEETFEEEHVAGPVEAGEEAPGVEEAVDVKDVDVKEGEKEADILKEADTLEEAVPPPVEPHKLAILAVERTWIKYVIDDSDPAEVLLQPGERVSWEARKGFFLRIGNAGGVYLTFDGEPLGLAGESGEVVELTLPRDQGPADIRETAEEMGSQGTEEDAAAR